MQSPSLQQKKPNFVLISDIHYRLDTLLIADAALNQAIQKANALHIPLIIAGDLIDTKAIIRGECVNALITTVQKCNTPLGILVGNHDRLNEKAPEHNLNFLRPYANIIDKPESCISLGIFLLPYTHDPRTILKQLEHFSNGAAIVMHQGILGAAMGDYIVDTSSLDPTLLPDVPIFSGHYHRHQRVNQVTYIGNPYTLTFGEANDGEKGFLVVYDDYTFDLVPTHLRKHVATQCNFDEVKKLSPNLKSTDLWWLKVTGPFSELEKLDKTIIGSRYLGHANFKLDLIPTDDAQLVENTKVDMSDEQLFDELIDTSSETASQKIYLKQLWRELI